MKILFLISNFPDKNDPVSGIFYKRTILELVKHDVEIKVIAPRNIIKYFKNVVLKKEHLKEFNNVEENFKISVYRPFYFPIPGKLSNRLKVYMLYRSVSRCIKRNNIDFDIIDSRYAFPWCYVASKISTKISKPFLSTVVGDDINLDIFQSNFIRSCVKRTLEQANGIVCVSEELQKGILTNFGISNTHIIYDGIDFDGFREFIEVKKKAYKFPEDKLTLGYVGHISPGKGCDVLLSIINLTGNRYNWIIIGDGPSKKIFKSSSNVLILGNLEPSEVLKWYNSMDLFLFPSHNEGIPNVLKEAAFFNLPIISSSVGGIPEMTNSGSYATLIEDFKNPQSFITAIGQFESDILFYKEKAMMLKAFVTLNFQINVSAVKLMNLYKEIIKG